MSDSPAEAPIVANGAAVKRLVETVPDADFASDVEAALRTVHRDEVGGQKASNIGATRWLITIVAGGCVVGLSAAIVVWFVGNAVAGDLEWAVFASPLAALVGLVLGLGVGLGVALGSWLALVFTRTKVTRRRWTIVGLAGAAGSLPATLLIVGPATRWHAAIAPSVVVIVFALAFLLTVWLAARLADKDVSTYPSQRDGSANRRT